MRKQTLYFIHANGFPSGSYSKLFSALTKKYRILAPDKLGHNPKYAVDDNWSGLTRQVIADIQASADMPVIGVGHSLGGILAFLAAQRQPDIFRGFVMLDPPIYLGATALAIRLAKHFGFIDYITPAGKAMRRRTEWTDMDQAFESMSKKPFFRNFDHDCLRDYITHATVATQAGLHLSYDARTEAEIFRTLPHNLGMFKSPPRVPGFIICGKHSEVVYKRYIYKLAQRHSLPVNWISGGHMFPLEHPLDAAHLLGVVLSRCFGSA